MDRPDEALAALQTVLSHMPDHEITHANLAILYSELGREEEARAEVAEVLRINPRYTLEGMRKGLFLYKDPAPIERDLAALRKAGLE